MISTALSYSLCLPIDLEGESAHPPLTPHPSSVARRVRPVVAQLCGIKGPVVGRWAHLWCSVGEKGAKVLTSGAKGGKVARSGDPGWSEGPAGITTTQPVWVLRRARIGEGHHQVRFGPWARGGPET